MYYRRNLLIISHAICRHMCSIDLLLSDEKHDLSKFTREFGSLSESRF